MNGLFDQPDSDSTDLLAVNAYAAPCEVPPSFRDRYAVIARRLHRVSPGLALSVVRERAMEELCRLDDGRPRS